MKQKNEYKVPEAEFISYSGSVIVTSSEVGGHQHGSLDEDTISNNALGYDQWGRSE